MSLGVAIGFRIEGCFLRKEMAAEITPLGAAFQATWSYFIDPEKMVEGLCQVFLGENTT